MELGLKPYEGIQIMFGLFILNMRLKADKSSLLFSLLLSGLFTTLAGCNEQRDSIDKPKAQPSVSNAGHIDRARLLAIEREEGAWLTGGRDYQQSYYSPLKKINKHNINQLGFAWQYSIDTTHGFEATPIVVDGVMFSSGPMGAVYAIDAKAGIERWVFEPVIEPGTLQKVCCGPINRGVAVWEGSVYVASIDGYLYALNADTGAIRWKVNTLTDRSRGYTITGAPYIANKVVVIGNSGAELDARGYVTAYDTDTGKQRWRFFTVPGNPEQGFEHPEMALAAKTWDPDSRWEVGLGGTVWDGMAYDPVLNLLYIGTGNAALYPRTIRSPEGGDNLFLSSIIAINPDTGRMAWYYQTTPADSWDYTAVQKMILAELAIKGQRRKVIMQAPKNGFFYVLDRITGELISAEPYIQINWASHIDKATGKPVETGQADYFDSPKLIFPGPAGGHNWQPMAYNPNTQLVYIPTIEAPAVYHLPKAPFIYKQGAINKLTNYYFPVKGPWGVEENASNELPPFSELSEGQPDPTVRGVLKAWDPIKQKVAWQVETSGQWRGSFFAIWNGGGVMTSAGGLVFQGRGKGNLVVIDANTGQQLHSIDVGTSMMAAPMTYSIDGEQYIAIMAGLGGTFSKSQPPGTAAYRYGNQGRIVAFKLGGGEVPKPPEQDPQDQQFPMPPVNRSGDVKAIQSGGELFQRNCSQCHSNRGGAGIPDLRKMDQQTHADFLDIVLKGIREDKGMGNFSAIVSPAEAEWIHAYLIDLAWRTYAETNKAPLSHQPESL